MHKVLIFGGSGMLGHKIAQVLAPKYEVWVTVQGAKEPLAATAIVPAERILPHTQVEQLDTVAWAVQHVRPTVMVNCVGIVKQRAAAKEVVPSLQINALFPHQLAELARTAGTRLIHISTDCVFSGHRGGYTEDDVADARDLYGRTKFLGEVAGEEAITVRTSIIGRALHGAEGLVEWFLEQREQTLRGYTEAVFSGVTTATLAGVIADVVIPQPALHGIYHVAAAPIRKYDLLMKLRNVCALPMEIVPDAGLRIDRSLHAARFCAATGWVAPSWDGMLTALGAEVSQYDSWRKHYAARK